MSNAKRGKNVSKRAPESEKITTVEAFMTALDELEEMGNRIDNLRSILLQAIEDNGGQLPPEYKPGGSGKRVQQRPGFSPLN
jgi:hypothetical protein